MTAPRPAPEPDPALAAAKRAARAEAARRRAGVARIGLDRQAAGHALAAIGTLRDVRRVAGFLPIRDEIDPRPAMRALIGLGYAVCVPVIAGRGLPLRFRPWTERTALMPGPFGVPVPKEGPDVRPDALLVPLLAFDAEGWRLGYGGGFYDRTLAALRAAGRTTAIGFAFAAQEIPRAPRGPADARLDAVATERGFRRFAAAGAPLDATAEGG